MDGIVIPNRDTLLHRLRSVYGHPSLNGFFNQVCVLLANGIGKTEVDVLRAVVQAWLDTGKQPAATSYLWRFAKVLLPRTARVSARSKWRRFTRTGTFSR